MRLDRVNYRLSQPDEPGPQDDTKRQNLLTPARQAALDALERELRDLLSTLPR